ncbi:MAG: YHS domain-containing (seleno)protein [Bradyrhizobium sp.]
MTAQRQEGNGWRLATAFIVLLAACWLACPDGPADAGTSQRVVTSRFSGLAIDGFDPVAYFVNRRPMRGLAEYEAWENGVVWSFQNQGNRAAFIAHPEIYSPRFGGYDAVGVARGVTFAGNPRLFVIFGQRLYLFGLESNRDVFIADPERFLKLANTRWPALRQDLAR